MKKVIKCVAALAAALAMSGCVGMRDSIPIMGESEDGTQVVIANATRTRFYALSKAAEKIELWQVNSEKGVTMKGSDANSDSTAAIEILEKGMQIGAAYATARLGGAPLTAAVGASAPAASCEPAGTADGAGADVYSTEGYGASPGPNGVGVYGRPACGLCRSYRSAHGGVEMVNVDVPANNSAMWAALRSRGCTSTSIKLPVVITDDGYTVSAR
jgi:hypothetical protein